MSAACRFLVRFNGYPLSAVIAVLLHGFTLGFILYWNSSSDSSEFELVQPTVIKALFIDENPQLRERRRLKREQIQRRARLEEDRRRQQRAEEERQQLAEEERQRQAEAERLRQRQIEQRRRLDEEEEERQRLLELERQREAERDRERQRELAERQRRHEQEEAERGRQREAAAARTEFEVVQSGMALIRQFVQDVWNRPSSARNGMRAALRISMLPTGEVVDVAVIESSGDAAFDRSAENAVYSAQPFSELEQMPIRIFNANFRILSLIFEPEDLLN